MTNLQRVSEINRLRNLAKSIVKKACGQKSYDDFSKCMKRALRLFDEARAIEVVMRNETMVD